MAIGTAKKKLCVYCGTNPATTDDHVPPKTIFLKPRPKLVTVPSCKQCNVGCSKDDEYFRNMLVQRHDVNGETATKLREIYFRALNNPKAKGMARAFVNNQKFRDVYSAGGIYLGSASTFIADLKRINRVVRRTAIGLHWEHLKTRLPEGYEMFVRCLSNVDEAEKRNFTDLGLMIMGAGKAFAIGTDTFNYSLTRPADRPDLSM